MLGLWRPNWGTGTTGRIRKGRPRRRPPISARGFIRDRRRARRRGGEVPEPGGTLGVDGVRADAAVVHGRVGTGDAGDVDRLLVCVRLRESDMPLADLKYFAELVRRGPGNEAERLRLLETHQQRVDARIRALEECRSVIAGKVGVYADHLARGEAGGLWDPTAEIGS
ncbi:MerR family DNA-binding protein [Streptomyces sp. NPDC085524]|uniref:MerR family DNA-binding protein n=1 Tax=Streptomyces sp. NPDC085524 TaxID=3365728 RepID=UPI0037D955BC